MANNQSQQQQPQQQQQSQQQGVQSQQRRQSHQTRIGVPVPLLTKDYSLQSQLQQRDNHAIEDEAIKEQVIPTGFEFFVSTRIDTLLNVNDNKKTLSPCSLKQQPLMW